MGMARQALLNRDVYPVSHAGHGGGKQRSHRSGGGGGAREILPNLATVFQRLAVGQPLAMHGAAHGEDRQLGVLVVFVGAGLSEGRDGRHYQVWSQDLQRVVTQFETSQFAG